MRRQQQPKILPSELAKKHVPSAGPEGHADAEYAGALEDNVRDHTVDSERTPKNGKRGEGGYLCDGVDAPVQGSRETTSRITMIRSMGWSG